MTHYIERRGSRIIVASPGGRILLFRAALHDGTTLWFPPGGGLEDHETFEEAALRELFEETGIEVKRLGPCVWHRTHEVDDGGPYFDHQPMRFMERYYLLPVEAEFPPLPMLIGAYEDYMREPGWFRWLRPADLATLEAAVIVPRDLATLVVPLLAGEVPATPLEIGE
ncbi:MAG: NUDIX domain-containing protein [Dehalococcoidia bacterium]